MSKIYEIGTGYTPIPAQIGAATEIVVEELTRSLIKNGEDAQIIDIKASNRAKTELPIIEVKVPGMFTGTDISLGLMHKLKRVVYSVKLALKLRSILKKATEQVILHFHNQYNLYFFLKLVSAKIRKKAIIAYTVHSYIWGDEWKRIESTVRKKYFQEIYSVKNADLVFVLNDITAEHFEKRLGVDPIHIHKVVNGVNTERYAPLDCETVCKLKKKNKLDGKKVIFQVGSVCDRKNQLGSVKMLTDYMKAHEDVVYMYAGGVIDSEYHQKLFDFAKEEGIADRIVYVGELSPGEQLNEYYNMADCSVFTSVLESFGLVIIEAISTGTPVIIGENLMFELQGGYSMYHNEAEFIHMVDEALNKCEDPINAIRGAVGKYAWDVVAAEYIAIFNCCS